jgi:hypothetical protein
MEQDILNAVGKKIKAAYLNATITNEQLMKIYTKNKKEADDFSLFGYKAREIAYILKCTHNPILKKKLEAYLEESSKRAKLSKEQNELSISKLNHFKKTACGIGLRKVIKQMKQELMKSQNLEKEILLLVLEAEFANISAKKYSGEKKEMIYNRKSFLLQVLSEKLKQSNWRYGINSDTGKNACYLIFVYLPNGTQLTWHSNDYYLYKYYPEIESTWDGQVCMTMEKIITYIEQNYFSQIKVS